MTTYPRWPLLIGIILSVAVCVQVASANLTFTGTNISGDTSIVVDGPSTISIGTSTATGITIGNSSGTTSFFGNVGIGIASSSSQFAIGGYTVNSGIQWPNGLPNGGNPQIFVNGNLDSTASAGSTDIAGGLLNWNTAGANSNIDGLMLRLERGYTGGHITRVLDAQNLIAGTEPLDVQDQSGIIGVGAESQGASTGDNVGIYSIAGFATGRNIAGVFRAYQDSTTTPGDNIGLLSVAGHYGDSYSISQPTAPETAGYFAIGVYHDPRPYLATSSALIADNGNMIAPIFIGKVAGVNAFQITPTGGVYDLPSANSTNFWQVANASGTPFFDLDTTNGRVGIGTQTPSTTLQVAGTLPTVRIGASSLAGCVEVGNSDGSAGINYVTFLNGAMSATTTKPSVCE